jgi:hypothetical protein
MSGRHSPAAEPGSDVSVLAPVLHEDRLRIVGRRLDIEHYRSAIIVETPDGLFVRATRVDKQTPLVLHLSDAEVREAVTGLRRQRGGGERVERHPLLPTGYEDFLRALGNWLDEQTAHWVSIHEFKERIVVSAQIPRVTFRSTTMEAVETSFEPDDIVTLVDAAYRRRGSGRRGFIRRLIGGPSN